MSRGLSVFRDQSRSGLVEEAFDFASVLQRFPDQGNQIHGNIQASAPALERVGKHVRGMFLPAGTERATRADAGLMNQCERAFQGRPEGSHLFQKGSGTWCETFFLFHRRMYVI